MLVLLPPSERKAAPTPRPPGAAPGRRPRTPPPLHLPSLSAPELTGARERVLTALAEVSARDDAASVLGTGPAAAHEVAANTRWRTDPARPVADLYTGVLFEALDLPSLPPAARRRAGEAVRVVSAAHGLLRLDDAVPAYRLAMGVSLPGTGPLAAHWRPHLAGVLDPLLAAAGQVVLDVRSSTYAQAWRPPGDLAPRVVAVRVLTVAAGRTSVVSHAAKRTRGLVARHLLSRPGRAPRTADALVAAIAEAFEVDEGAPRAGQRTIDVVLRP